MPVQNKEVQSRSSLQRACKPYGRSQTQITDLPTEVLIIILSHLNKYDLFLNVRLVSKLFYRLATARPVWGTVDLPPDVPYSLLETWLKCFGTYVRHFRAEGRTDGDKMFCNISRYCPQLVSISAVNVHGTPQSKVVHSRPLCMVLMRCKKLASVRLSKCSFFSCKFFKLLLQPTVGNPLRKMVQYRGPMSRKQLMTLLDSLKQNRSDMSVQLSGTIL